jgi:cytochrome c oxidase subunit II
VALLRRLEQVVARGSGLAAISRAKSQRIRRAVTLGVVAIGAALALSGCSAKNAFALGWPHGGITHQSNQMYDLWIGTVIAAAVVGLIVYALIFWCIIRYRKKSAEIPVQTRYNLPIELIYSVVPFLIIAVLFYYTARTETNVDKLSAHPDVTIGLNAFKWNWEFDYTDTAKTGAQVSEIGDSSYVPILVVPTDKTIEFVEHSQDVIHSFWVPALLFKRDVFPGNITNRFQVEIHTPGAYVGRCAELCGTYHSQMNFELLAVSPAQYKQYLSERQSGMSTPDAIMTLGLPQAWTGKQGYAVTTHPFDTSRTGSTATP